MRLNHSLIISKYGIVAILIFNFLPLPIPLLSLPVLSKSVDCI